MIKKAIGKKNMFYVFLGIAIVGMAFLYLVAKMEQPSMMLVYIAQFVKSTGVIAAILMIIHGGFMELGGIFAMIPALLIGTDKYDIGKYFEFKLPYFQENLYMMMVMGAIYGVFRLIGAIGLLKNRMWGLVLSVINCVFALLFVTLQNNTITVLVM